MLAGEKTTNQLKPELINTLQPQTPDGSLEEIPTFQPQTPDGSPPGEITTVQPQTPDGSPPGEITTVQPQTHNDLPTEETNNKGKQEQLNILQQTFADVTKKRLNKQKNIFNPIIDIEKIVISVNEINKTINDKLLTLLKNKIESKCNKHGLIKKDSIKVVNISSPSVHSNLATFHITYQSLVCNPVEGMLVECKVVNVTKAGIRAELINYDTSPIVIFIARDHHNNNTYFNNIKDGEIINVKIIGVRYELNDNFVSSIGELHRI
jgi:DNA-directed RNA polymerase subunit E'/Rpb7